MRLELAGTLIKPPPLIIRYTANATFLKQQYLDMGYTNYEVICIGAGGGAGGSIDTKNSGTLVRNYGGAGGGGGYHRVLGFLEFLPASCAVVVGVGGVSGVNHISDPTKTTDGFSGGYSSFGGTVCRASGGYYGNRAQTNSVSANPMTNGGWGGVGNRTAPGGGPYGGAPSTPNVTTPSQGYAGIDGKIANFIGEGGGGGAGGVGKYGLGDGKYYSSGTDGARGSYNPSDLSAYGLGQLASNDPNGCGLIVPGAGGGARATPLNGLPNIYGTGAQTSAESGDPGYVVIRITAE